MLLTEQRGPRVGLGVVDIQFCYIGGKIIWKS